MEKINKLKKLINSFGLDGYIIPKNDEFFSEYIPIFKDRLRYISNFTGSYGYALILKNKNYLFVDGRYKLQAKIESGKLFKVIQISKKFPVNIIKQKNIKIGYDPKLHTSKFLKSFFNKSNFELKSIDHNLVDSLWIKKSKIKYEKFYTLPKKAYGLPYKSKLNLIIKILKRKKVDYQFISSGENVAWLLNMRGRDSKYSPVPNAYLTISIKKQINLYCNLKKINRSLRKQLKNINFIDLKHLETNLSRLKNEKVLIDPSSCSKHFENIIGKKNKLLFQSDPVNLLKSIKTKKEIKNMMKSHIYDGAALTKFLFWIKNNYKKSKIDEIYAQKKLLKFRKKNKDFKFSSFPTISGSGPNGAIIHYRATLKSNRTLKNGDIYLVDSGGQYNYGTTDVTRTISLNNNNKRIKEIFTRVLKGHIAVASFKLSSKSYGAQLDGIARKPLKKIDLDYSHGTGHGVGYFLNVHEGPQSFSRNNKVILRKGMILSNEPGYYEDGKFGIRIENLIMIIKSKRKHFFENLTMVPIDKTLIKKDMLKKKEIDWLNNYHKKVFTKLKYLMNKSELANLKSACSKI